MFHSFADSYCIGLHHSNFFRSATTAFSCLNRHGSESAIAGYPYEQAAILTYTAMNYC